jgi:hypothetical protein
VLGKIFKQRDHGQQYDIRHGEPPSHSR